MNREVAKPRILKAIFTGVLAVYISTRLIAQLFSERTSVRRNRRLTRGTKARYIKLYFVFLTHSFQLIARSFLFITIANTNFP